MSFDTHDMTDYIDLFVTVVASSFFLSFLLSSISCVSALFGSRHSSSIINLPVCQEEEM